MTEFLKAHDCPNWAMIIIYALAYMLSILGEVRGYEKALYGERE